MARRGARTKRPLSSITSANRSHVSFVGRLVLYGYHRTPPTLTTIVPRRLRPHLSQMTMDIPLFPRLIGCWKRASADFDGRPVAIGRTPILGGKWVGLSAGVGADRGPSRPREEGHPGETLRLADCRRHRESERPGFPATTAPRCPGVRCSRRGRSSLEWRHGHRVRDPGRPRVSRLAAPQLPGSSRPVLPKPVSRPTRRPLRPARTKNYLPAPALPVPPAGRDGHARPVQAWFPPARPPALSGRRPSR